MHSGVPYSPSQFYHYVIIVRIPPRAEGISARKHVKSHTSDARPEYWGKDGAVMQPISKSVDHKQLNQSHTDLCTLLLSRSLAKAGYRCMRNVSDNEFIPYS